MKAAAKSPIRWRVRLLQAAVISLLLLIAGAVWMVYPYWGLIEQFGKTPTRQPSRLYGRNAVLQKGQSLTPAQLETLLDQVGYLRESQGGELRRGFYRPAGEGFYEVGRRRFPTPKGFVGNDLLRIGLRDGAVFALLTDGRPIPEAFLDPPLLASFRGKDLRERFHTPIDDLPEHLIWSVLAAEDTNFLQHPGVSVLGIARAAWANLVAGELKQGGSTLTQQLVKNIFLTHERTAKRKLREAVLALLIDWRYEKREILDAYLNEIYWGKVGSANIMGIGAAARAYFGKEPSQLSLAEAACLAGMIQSPANLSPLSHPEASKKRRDAILIRLAELQWITTEQAEAALTEPIRATRPRTGRVAPYFSDFAADEARERFGVQALEDAGYSLVSTLSASDQLAAEAAVAEGIHELEETLRKKGQEVAPLQAALISLDPKTGGILAYVGGRNYQQSQFDRVRQARRQAGSAFKPIVFATAFEKRLVTPATFLEDEPFTLRLPSGPWSPQNNDDKYRGWVSVRTTLEESLNVPTARLAVTVGLEHVVEMAKRLGVKSPLNPFPALALGAMEVSPLELSTVYATLAAGGTRQETHALVAVFDRQGQAVTALRGLEAPTKAVAPEVAFVLSKTLQSVVESGTAASLAELGLRDPLAGKTGTSNSRRDNWFAAYSPERSTLVWVGYDDNSKTKLSGSKAALPIFARFGIAVRPARGFSDFRLPKGAVVAWIDPRTGGLADERCSQRRQEFFLDGALPPHACADRGAGRVRLGSAPGTNSSDAADAEKHPYGDLLRRLRQGGDGNRP